MTRRTHRAAAATGNRLVRILLIVLGAALLGSCAAPQQVTIPEPLREPKPEPADAGTTVVDELTAERPDETRFSVQEIAKTRTAAGLQQAQDPIVAADGSPIDVNIDSVPLPVFINAIFGNLLNLSFQMEPGVRDNQSLVTLRASEGQTPEQLYGLAVQVLDSFGIRVNQEGELLNFVQASTTTEGDVPLLVSGRNLPDVPATHREVFQFVPLHVVRNVQVRSWLQTLYANQGLSVVEDPARNAVMLQGPPTLVRVALEAIEVLDQPSMRGRISLRITPAYRSAEGLTDDLINVLEAEGYGVSRKPPIGAIFLVPLEAINSVAVFAGDRTVLEHVRKWAKELDRPPETTSNAGIFAYEAQNTSVESIASVVGQLIGSAPSTVESEEAADGASTAANGDNRLVVDPDRNTVLFQGKGEEWARLRPVIEQLDKPARLALVEVTIAEVTLTDEYQFGIEWALEQSNLDISTEGGLGLGGQGLNFFIQSDSGRTRAVLNAFASNDRVSILSTPRLMVRSGEQATIDVGTEVPIITSSATTTDLDNSILQNITYRKTGVLLTVRPIIHASNRIDLEVRQEVSESQPNTSSGIDSPEIFDRSIETSLSLRDGGSVMIGGLITDNVSSGENKVPFFGDIPFFGRLFRSESQNTDRTELIVIIVPYILDDYEDAEAITRSMRERMSIEVGSGSITTPDSQLPGQ